MRKPLASRPLFWRVFWGNAVVLAVVVMGLVFGQVSAPLTLTESIVLVATVAVALAISLVLMRPAFRPFDAAGGPYAPA